MEALHIISRFITTCIIVFIGWISFVPEPIQSKYVNLIKVFLGVILLMSLLRHRFNVSKFFFSRNDKFFWIYIASLSVGLIAATNRTIAWNLYLNLAIFSCLIYFIIKNGIGRSNLNLILFSFVLFSFLVALIGILEWIFAKNIIYTNFIKNFYYNKYISERRIMSTLISPAILGTYLLTCAPLSYYFYNTAKNIFKKRIYLVFLTITIVGLLLTQSRGSLFGGLIGLSIYLWLRDKKRHIFILWILFFIFPISVDFLPFENEIKYRFSITYLIRYIQHSHRTLHYFVTLNMLKAHPFVGIGWHHYRMLFNQYSKVRLPYVIMIPESTYLMHLAEAGLIGFFVFVLFLLKLLKRAMLYLHNSEINSRKLLGFILIGFIGLLFNIGTYDAFLWPTPFYLFWVYAGILSNETIR